MKKIATIFLFFLTHSIVFGQIQKSIPFDLKGAVDANFINHSFWLGNDICTIARINGKQNRTSSFAIVRYDNDLNQVWRSSVTTSDYEDLLGFFELDEGIFVLVNGYNPETKLAYVTQSEIHKKTGDWMKTDTIISDTIFERNERASKA